MAGNLLIHIEGIGVSVIGIDLSIEGLKDHFAYGILAILFRGKLYRFHFQFLDALLVAKIEDSGIEHELLPFDELDEALFDPDLVGFIEGYDVSVGRRNDMLTD